MDIKWEQVKPDFSNSSASMKNTLTSLSQAGTVFDKMRQSILDEEQRATENAYKQQLFDENARQFGLQYALNQDKLAEQIRAAQANEAYKNRVLAEQARANSANEQLRKQQLANEASYRNAMLAVNRDRVAKEDERNKIISEETLKIINGKINYDTTISKLQDDINNASTPEEKAKAKSALNNYKAMNAPQWTAQGMNQQMLQNVAAKGAGVIGSTPFTSEAQSELARTNAAIQRADKQKENRLKGETEATKLIQGMNLTSDQQALAQQVLAKAATLYPDVPQEALANVIASMPTYNAWLDFDNKNAFSADLFDNTLKDFISGVNLENNPINMLFANKALTYERNK